jgi:hypothetical protein
MTATSEMMFAEVSNPVPPRAATTAAAVMPLLSRHDRTHVRLWGLVSPGKLVRAEADGVCA